MYLYLPLADLLTYKKNYSRNFKTINVYHT